MLKERPICYSCENYFIQTHCHRAENMCKKNHYRDLEEEPEIKHCADFNEKKQNQKQREKQVETPQISNLQDEIIKVIQVNTLPNDLGTSNLNESDISIISKEIDEVIRKKLTPVGVRVIRLCGEIEDLPASEQQTKVSLIASEIRMALNSVME